MTDTLPAAADADVVTEHPDLHRPEAFTQQGLGWVPWLRPVAEADLTDVQREALVEPSRAAMPYFRLLARDPEALRARTLTDLDIFFNTDGGVGRAERELAAAATSRHNGCVFCASVHAAAATRESGRRDDVQRLLDEGVHADLGDERWNAVVAASVHLAETPLAFGAADVERLRAAGLDDAEIVDVVNGAAFFNWANRLMLSLGEPEVPTSRRGGAA
ncbi:alkylhydroperoxidase domain protein [Kineococcus sp. SYSU DK002]|uniref:alkylhydroperoxidase domain protein n=1 Tax=Kineococcus sp. SYSU DK002 TaxID=3383123 RepID=UPI003D7EB7C7